MKINFGFDNFRYTLVLEPQKMRLQYSLRSIMFLINFILLKCPSLCSKDWVTKCKCLMKDTSILIWKGFTDQTTKMKMEKQRTSGWFRIINKIVAWKTVLGSDCLFLTTEWLLKYFTLSACIKLFVLSYFFYQNSFWWRLKSINLVII